MKIFRQGDVMLERVEAAELGTEFPRDGAGRVVLAYGEVTGHAHAFHESHVSLFSGTAANEGVFLRVVETEAFLRHEEHREIAVPPGLYRVRRQREWSDELEPIQVAD